MTLATDALRHELDRRLDAAGWGLFFLMSGALLLIPGVPDGTWLAGVGAILLGFSAVRWMTGLTMSWFAVIFGVVALASGAGAIVGVSVPVFALLLTESRPGSTDRPASADSAGRSRRGSAWQ